MSNSFYVASLAPATGSQGSSAVMRAEFAAIEGGFDLLPTLSSVPYHVVHVNAGSSALTTTAGFSFDGATLSVPGVIVGTGGMAITGNITLADYYISYDGTDAGISIDASQNVTLSAGLSVNGSTLTINAGTWTIGSNFTATRAAGAAAAGVTRGATWATTFSGDSGGTTNYIAQRITNTASGSNAIAGMQGIELSLTHSASATLTLAANVNYSFTASGTGNTTTSFGVSGSVASTGANTITTAYLFNANAPTISGGGAIGTLRGLNVGNLGNAGVTTATGVYVADFTSSTNMRGIQSALSSGTGKYNLYIDGTAQNYMAGTLTVGTTSASAAGISVSKTLSDTGAQEYGSYFSVQASNASGAVGKWGVASIVFPGSSYGGTSALASFYAYNSHAQALTVPLLIGLYFAGAVSNASATVTAWDGIRIATVSNSGTVTTFTGVNVQAQTAASTIYGIRSQIASTANRYNLYIDGTANNYLSGNTAFGATSSIGIAKISLRGSFTSDGSSSVAYGTLLSADATAASGDTTGLHQLGVTGSLTTAGATEAYSVVSTARFNEPVITVGSGDTITVAASVYIASAPTEGSTNAALYVASGASYFLGAVHATTGLTVGATSGVLTFPDGTVTQPGARVGTSSTTGLFSGSDNSLRISNNQVESLTTVSVSSGVSVGIGQSAPISAANKVYLHIGDGDTSTVNQEARIHLQTGNAAGGARTWAVYSNVADYTFTIEDTAATTYGLKVNYNNGAAGAGAVYPITDSQQDLGLAGSIAWRTLYADRLHIGGLTQLDYFQHRIIGNFTSGGASTYAYQMQVSGTLTLASGDTGNSGGALFNTAVTTQGASETINLISTVYIAEPLITVGTGDTVTTATCLYVESPPTEAGSGNWSAIFGGTVYFGGKVYVGQGSSGTGVATTSYSLGTITSGTVTPDPWNCPFQHYTNNGAHTLAPAGVTGSIIVDITNAASAGAITTSGFTQVSGDSFTTTNGHKFRCSITIGNAGSLLAVTALQ